MVYPDFGTFAGIARQGNDPIAMRECIEFIEAEFLKIGLEFNGSKCEWMSATHPCPFDNWLAPKDYVKILGEGFDLGSMFALTAQKDWNQGATNAN